MKLHKNIFLLFGFLLTSMQACAMEAPGPFVGYKNNNLTVSSLQALSFQTVITPDFLNNLDLRLPMPKVLQNLEFIEDEDDIKSSLLACCSELVLWGVLEGKCLQALNGHTSWISSIGVIDKNRVVTGSDDKTAKIWYIPSPDNFTLFQLILLIKLEYARQQKQTLHIGPDWAPIFFNLPKFMRDRYFRVIECIIQDVSDDEVMALSNSFRNMTFETNQPLLLTHEET